MLAGPNINSTSRSLQGDAPNMITTPSARPLMPCQNIEPFSEPIPLKEYPTNRGYSDSEIPSCRATRAKKHDIYHLNGLSHNNLAAPVSNDLGAPVLDADAKQTEPQHVKTRGNLQLPSFKTLGISSRLPAALLTPPDESILDLRPVSPPNLISRSSSQPPPNMLKTPSPDRGDFLLLPGTGVPSTQNLGFEKMSLAPIEPNEKSATVPSSNLSNTEAPSSPQAAVAMVEPQETSQEPSQEQAAVPTSSSNGEEAFEPAHDIWTVDAINAAGMLDLSWTVLYDANDHSCKH